MDKKRNKTKDINIRLTPELKQRYLTFCENANINMSKHIRQLIKDSIK